MIATVYGFGFSAKYHQAIKSFIQTSSLQHTDAIHRLAADWLEPPGVSVLGVIYQLATRTRATLLKPPAMTRSATMSPLGLPAFCQFFSENVEFPVYSPNGGVRFI